MSGEKLPIVTRDEHGQGVMWDGREGVETSIGTVKAFSFSPELLIQLAAQAKKNGTSLDEEAQRYLEIIARFSR